jgi:Tfp pilus assembly protein PilV
MNEIGDTIVEVLFAVVVIGIVLTGAYAVVTHSITDEQDAQEHSYALGLVQSQIEQLRAYIISNPSGTLPFSSETGCMYSSTTAPVTLTPELNTINGTSSYCLVQGNLPTNSQYTLSIKLASGSNPTTSPLYEVSVKWPSLLAGGSIDRLSIPYRVN